MCSERARDGDDGNLRFITGVRGSIVQSVHKQVMGGGGHCPSLGTAS